MYYRMESQHTSCGKKKKKEFHACMHGRRSPGIKCMLVGIHFDNIQIVSDQWSRYGIYDGAPDPLPITFISSTTLEQNALQLDLHLEIGIQSTLLTFVLKQIFTLFYFIFLFFSFWPLHCACTYFWTSN